MNKRFFTSLLLGFGGTLAVLVALSMPPGGWGVAVGVALGLLAALPLFLIVMALLKRPTAGYQTEHNYEYREAQPQMPPVVIIQPQLPQGQAMPLPPNINTYDYLQPEQYGYTYSSKAAPNEYQDYQEYYDQSYLPEELPDPRLFRKPSRHRGEYQPVRRTRPNQARTQPRYNQDYYDYSQNQYGFPDEIQAQYEDWDNQSYFEPEISGEAITPPDLAYYEEQQLRRRRDADKYNVRPMPQSQHNQEYRRSRSVPAFDPDESDQIVEAEYREIHTFEQD